MANEPDIPLFDSFKDKDIFDKAVHAVTRLNQLNVSSFYQLVRSWLQRGVNLSLAGPLVATCNNAVLDWAAQVATQGSESEGSFLDIQQRAQLLLRNTNKATKMERGYPTVEFSLR
jgi:hypothetical protein